MLMLVTGVALTGWNWISHYRKAGREQDAFIAAIHALGGTVSSDIGGHPWFPVRTGHFVSFNGPSLRDKDLAHLSTFPAAKSVFRGDFRSSPVTDAGLAHLAKWTGMRVLYLDRSPITDRGIRNFARAKTGGLNTLRVAECRGITDGSIDDLLSLTPHYLAIDGTSITPAGTATLRAHVGPRSPRTNNDP